jgi:protease-4
MKTFWKIVFGSLLGCLIAMLVAMFIFFGMAGSMASASMKSKTAPKTGSVLRIDKTCVISERAAEDISAQALMSRQNGSKITLLDAVRTIDAAASDPAIKFIYMNTDDLNLSFANAEEFRAALKRFRDSGKAIVAYGENPTVPTYYLASVADKVVMNTDGEAMMMGVATQGIFIKDLLDKLGVEVQLIRHGKYKAAGEMFIKNEMSAENREQLQAMVDGLWGSMADEICESRGFTREELDGWLNNLELLNAQSLLDRKLVDTIYFADQMKDYLCNLASVEKFEKIGFVKLTDYAPGKLVQHTKAKEKVAVLYANGEIVMDGDTEQDIVGAKFAAEVEKVRKDSTIKAVVFRVNSPGGSVEASQFVRREMELLRATKPVIASYGEYAASGGYWISAECDKIFCDNTTLTGSIGVFGLVPNIGSAAKKTLKVNIQSVNSHSHSDMMGGTRSLDAAEQQYMQNSIEEIYNQFLGIVAGGRNMTTDAVDEIAQGRVWCGCDAFGIGLADEKGGLVDAIAYAASAAGLEDYRLVEYPVAKSTMERFMEMFGGASAKAFFKGSQPASRWEEIQARFEQAYGFLKNAEGIQVYARMPFIAEIK